MMSHGVSDNYCSFFVINFITFIFTDVIIDNVCVFVRAKLVYDTFTLWGLKPEFRSNQMFNLIINLINYYFYYLITSLYLHWYILLRNRILFMSDLVKLE